MFPFVVVIALFSALLFTIFALFKFFIENKKASYQLGYKDFLPILDEYIDFPYFVLVFGASLIITDIDYKSAILSKPIKNRLKWY